MRKTKPCISQTANWVPHDFFMLMNVKKTQRCSLNSKICYKISHYYFATRSHLDTYRAKIIIPYHIPQGGVGAAEGGKEDQAKRARSGEVYARPRASAKGKCRGVRLGGDGDMVSPWRSAHGCGNGAWGVDALQVEDKVRVGFRIRRELWSGLVGNWIW